MNRMTSRNRPRRTAAAAALALALAGLAAPASASTGHTHPAASTATPTAPAADATAATAGPTAATATTNAPAGEHPTSPHAGSWKPTQYDTCSAKLHDSYQVIAPDGMKYEGWHPSSVTDPATGKRCTFGHEHGDDPKTSKIYQWVIGKLGGETNGIPFGYAAAQTDLATGGALPHRHEDDPGQKVIVRNDVKQLRADRTGYAKGADGKPIVCSYLMKMHQGSHSSDALKNNAHELLYAARCSDGTELMVDTLALFGQPNQFQENCSDTIVKTTGSQLPASKAGKRLIPNTDCVQKYVQSGPKASSDVWGVYENWQAESTITGPDGKAKASFDPWFGVRNPSRVGSGSDGVPTASLYTSATNAYPWSTMDGPLEQQDPASPFNGAQRDVYVHNTTVANAGGPTTWYTDAYGNNASDKPFAGSVKQYVSATSNTGLPELERRAYGFSTDYGSKGSGVHAPN